MSEDIILVTKKGNRELLTGNR